VKNGTYLPDAQSFTSGLPEGKSVLAPEGAKGRTRRERESGKQSKRFQRIRDRSNADREQQGKVRK
jgi:hypothetical protein